MVLVFTVMPITHSCILAYIVMSQQRQIKKKHPNIIEECVKDIRHWMLINNFCLVLTIQKCLCSDHMQLEGLLIAQYLWLAFLFHHVQQ